MRYSSLKAEEDKQRETEYIPKEPQTLHVTPTDPSVGESNPVAVPHMTPSVQTADEIVTQAIQEAYDKERKTQIQNQTCTPANLTNEMTNIILDEVVDSVFEELEAALGKFQSNHSFQTISGRPLNNGLSVLVAQIYSEVFYVIVASVFRDLTTEKYQPKTNPKFR